MSDRPATSSAYTGAELVLFANPNLRCAECQQPVTGRRRRSFTERLEPCGHRGYAVSVRPSWGPLDGYTCPDHSHQDYLPRRPIT